MARIRYDEDIGTIRQRILYNSGKYFKGSNTKVKQSDTFSREMKMIKHKKTEVLEIKSQ